MSERRDELVRIAGDHFARKGFAATTVREIADEAGILSGSLYHHFDSKEAIAEDILTHYYDGMGERFRKIAEEAANPLEALRELTHTAYRGIADEPAAVALIQNSPELFRLPRFEHIASLAEELHDIWLAVIRRAIREGYIRRSTDPRLVYIFIRDAMWVTIRWWKPEGKYSIDDVANRFLDSMFFGIVDEAKRSEVAAATPDARRPRARAREAASAT